MSVSTTSTRGFDFLFEIDDKAAADAPKAISIKDGVDLSGADAFEVTEIALVALPDTDGADPTKFESTFRGVIDGFLEVNYPVDYKPSDTDPAKQNYYNSNLSFPDSANIWDVPVFDPTDPASKTDGVGGETPFMVAGDSTIDAENKDTGEFEGTVEVVTTNSQQFADPLNGGDLKEDDWTIDGVAYDPAVYDDTLFYYMGEVLTYQDIYNISYVDYKGVPASGFTFGIIKYENVEPDPAEPPKWEPELDDNGDFIYLDPDLSNTSSGAQAMLDAMFASGDLPNEYEGIYFAGDPSLKGYQAPPTTSLEYAFGTSMGFAFSDDGKKVQYIASDFDLGPLFEDDLLSGDEISFGYTGQGAAYRAPVCFLRGTKVKTSKGYVAIETLAIGDLVITDQGPSRVKFLSMTTHDSLTIPAEDLPVLIKKDALGASQPSEDLLVSPGHGVLIQNTLVHASALVNGTTIVQTERSDWGSLAPITYYNVEFEEHRLINVQGVVAESFFDILQREDWDNFNDYMRLYKVQQPLKELPLQRVQFSRSLSAELRLHLQMAGIAPVGPQAEAQKAIAA